MIKITPLSLPADPVRRLRVEGRIVTATAGELANACMAAPADRTPVLLDLAGVVFVDGDGAATLIELTRRHVTVVGCSPFVGTLLRAHEAHGPESTVDDDERVLVARLRAGDPDAFEAMVRRHGPRLLAVTRRLLRDQADAPSVAQEALLSAGEELGSLQGGVRIATWLHRIVVRIALTRLADRGPTAEPSLDLLLPRFDSTGHWAEEPRPWAVPDQDLERPETRALIRGCLDRLPEPFRTIMVLHDVEGVDVDEVAALLATTARAVKDRLHRARQALRTLLVGAPSVSTAHGPPRPIVASARARDYSA